MAHVPGADDEDGADDEPPPVFGNVYHANAQNDDLVSVSGNGDEGGDQGGGATNGQTQPQMTVSEGELVIPLFHTQGMHGASVDGRDSHITPYEDAEPSDVDESDDNDDGDGDDDGPSTNLYSRIWGGSQEGDEAPSDGHVPKLPRVNAKKTTKFDVRHVTCVGCNSDTRLDAEEIGEYIRRNLHTCAEEDLWRRAASEWKRIREERRLTNSKVLPTWTWKEIRNHFKKCCYDEQIDTLDDIRGVNQLINVTKGTMLRKHPESGMVTVHKDTFKQFKELMDLKLKLCANGKRKAPGR